MEQRIVDLTSKVFVVKQVVEDEWLYASYLNPELIIIKTRRKHVSGTVPRIFNVKK